LGCKGLITAATQSLIVITGFVTLQAYLLPAILIQRNIHFSDALYLIIGQFLRMTFLKRILFIIPFIFYASSAYAQDKPIGYWESLLPYNTALGVVTDGNIIYTISDQSFFTYDISSGEMQTYSKVNGMSDVGMASIAYDFSTSTAVLGYADGNIDLFKDNTFYNIPDFKLNVIPGTIAIYQIYAENGLAYLGIIQNYQITVRNVVLPVTSFAISHHYYYAATPNGLYRVSVNDPMIQVSAEWKNINYKDSIKNIAAINSTLFFANSKKVFTLTFDTLQPVYTSTKTIQHIDAGYAHTVQAYNYLFIGEGTTTGGKVKRMDFNYNIVDSIDCGTPTMQVAELADSSIWVACPTGGLQKQTGTDQTAFFIPDGPSSLYCFDIYSYNRNLWIAHGGYDEKGYAYSSYNGISNFNNNKWTLYKKGLYPPLNNTRDISSVTEDETKGILYAGSYLDGLFILHPNGSYGIVNQDPPFDGSYAYGAGIHQIIDMAFDKAGNLWLSQMFAHHQLCVKTSDSSWYSFGVSPSALGGPLVVDDSGQVWMVSSQNNGVYVYNTNNTLGNPGDDTFYHLTTGIGDGNLPSNQTNCIAKDLDNKIWIGTDNGIAIINNCNAPSFHTPMCDAEIPVVQYNNQNPGYLFAGYNVTSIAVDGGNRKWIGTDDGLWLLSPDGSQVIYAFTTDNSPLPSNSIMKISIDKVTGDVYIGTYQGLVSYRSSATDGGTSYSNVLTFPNPVPSGYTGTIAIKGLVSNADVRITDIDGQLVYHTTALGGQAVWNGMDYTGHRPQSGVYIVFVSDADGKNTYTGKIVFIQ
jgi:hypothetical protein